MDYVDGMDDIFDPDAVYEVCPICNDEDTQIPPCAWCDGAGYVEHACSTSGPGWPD